MSKINETITLNGNEGLEIDFSRITYVAAVEPTTHSKPSWIQAHLTPAEIVANVNVLSASDGVVRFTEDDLEVYLKQWLEYHFNCGVASFRWVWDKFRDFKAA